MYSHVQVSRSDSLYAFIRSTCLVVGASLLIGLFGSIAIPLPFTPVPIATQPSLILLLSCLLGPSRTFAAVLGFLAQGAFGLPVFAGAVGGWAILTGPTVGYFIGYLAAALFVGHFFQRMKDKSSMRVFGLLAAGNALLFVFGVPGLAAFIGWKNALLFGVLPFIIGDVLKLIACVKILQRIRKCD